MPQINGVVTDDGTTQTTTYTGTATNKIQTFFFSNKQNGFILTNNDTAILTLKVSGRSYIINAEESVSISQECSSFNIIRSGVGSSEFSLTAYLFHSGVGEVPSVPKPQFLIEDNLTSTNTKSALSANQGRVLNEKITNFTPPNIPIEDNLTSININTALSANQGRVLNEQLSDIATNVNNFATLQDALTSIGSQTKTLLIQKNITITSNTTIPSNINLWFTPMGKFTVNNGITLTINGTITASLWKIFDGLGLVNGTPKITEVYPEWFGAKINDSSIDNAAIFDKTQRFFPKVKLGIGVYNFQTSLTPIYSASFEGSGRITDLGYNMTVLKQLNDIPTVQLGSPMATLKQIHITGDTSKPNNDGILFPCLGSQTVLDQVLIRQCGGHGIHAKGSSTYGVDNCNFSNVKIESCEGYGVKLNIDAGNSSGFNTSLFENVECTKNQLGGFYIDKAASLVFTRCHSFWNENRTPQTIHDYTLKSLAQNVVFLNCWAESPSEKNYLDPLHKGTGFFIDGAVDVKIVSPMLTLLSRGIHIKTGRNIIVESPKIDLLNWQSAADFIIESGAQDVIVRDFDKDNPIIANFCNTAIFHFNRDIPTSNRLPMNGHYRRGVRGRSHSYVQGTITQFEINAVGCSGTAGDSFFTYTSTSLRVGDNITLPTAGTSGAGLTCQITDIDVVQKRLYINTPVVTTFSNQVPATLQAKIYSETFGSGTSAITNPQEGDTIFTIFPNAHGHSGWKCTVGGGTPTWKTWGALV